MPSCSPLPCATKRSNCFLFIILMSTLLFMPRDTNMSGQQNCPSNCSHMSFTKSLRNISYSFRGMYQRNANFLSLFPCICQEAACQINNLDWLRHCRKTKPSVISATLLITNNKILAKTNGSVIILVNFSLPWLNKSYWTVCCFKIAEHFCNNFYLSFCPAIYRISLYIYSLSLSTAMYLLTFKSWVRIFISVYVFFYTHKILLVWMQRKMWTRWLCKSSIPSALNTNVFLLSYSNGACQVLVSGVILLFLVYIWLFLPYQHVIIVTAVPRGS